MIQCKKCLTIIVSLHVHDFQWCACGSVAIDGGSEYRRITGYSTDIEKDPSKFVSNV